VGSVNASALTALQSRINTERARRGLGNVTFTGGVAAGSPILATHFSELRAATETLNTLGSQTFNWSGVVASGVSITDVLPQIDGFISTLEVEVLASWKTLNPAGVSGNMSTSAYGALYLIPSAARPAGNVRYRASGMPTSGYFGGYIDICKTKYASMPASINGPGFSGHQMTHFFANNSNYVASTQVAYDGIQAQNATSSTSVNAFLGLGISYKDQYTPQQIHDNLEYTVYGMNDKPNTQNTGWINDTLGMAYAGFSTSSNSYGRFALLNGHNYYTTTDFDSSFPNLWIAANSVTTAPSITIEAYY